MAIQKLDDLKLNAKLGSEALSLSKQLSADNLQRTIAYVTLIVLVIIAFFISLADAKFDPMKILEAKFWIDFTITVGGGLFLKWIFGKYGSYEGHKHPAVVKALIEVEKDNITIEKNNLLGLFKQYISFNNMTRKIKAIRNNVYHKLAKKPKDPHLLQMKICIKYQEELLELNRETQREEYDKIMDKLEEMNFDLDAYRVKYPMINEDTLKTGFASANDSDEEQLSYSEMWQLFGKSSIITLATTLISILLAISSLVMDDVSMATLFSFVTRVGTYIANAYVGFTIAKSAVEKVKLNVLVNIHKFLRTFLEANSIPTEVVMATPGGEQIGINK